MLRVLFIVRYVPYTAFIISKVFLVVKSCKQFKKFLKSMNKVCERKCKTCLWSSLACSASTIADPLIFLWMISLPSCTISFILPLVSFLFIKPHLLLLVNVSVYLPVCLSKCLCIFPACFRKSTPHNL